MDYGSGKEEKLAKPSTEDLFRYLESQISCNFMQISWLVSEEGLRYEVCVFAFF